MQGRQRAASGQLGRHSKQQQAARCYQAQRHRSRSGWQGQLHCGCLGWAAPLVAPPVTSSNSSPRQPVHAWHPRQQALSLPRQGRQALGSCIAQRLFQALLSKVQQPQQPVPPPVVEARQPTAGGQQGHPCCSYPTLLQQQRQELRRMQKLPPCLAAPVLAGSSSSGSIRHQQPWGCRQRPGARLTCRR